MGNKNKLRIFLASFMLVGMIFCIKAKTQAPSKSDNVGGDEYNRVMLFMGDPIKYFDDIKDMKNLFFYISLHDVSSEEPFFKIFLCKHFATVNNRGASILVHLLYTKVGGDLGYLLIDHIIMLFKINPRPFISVLKKRKDWPYFADVMHAGDWMEFVSAVRNLSNPGFEGEFKRYVLKEK